MGMENWNDEGVKQIVENDIDSNGNEVVDVICEQPENFVFLKKHKCASSTFPESGQTIRLYDSKVIRYMPYGTYDMILYIRSHEFGSHRDWRIILDDNKALTRD